MFNYIHILSYYKLFLYFIVCLRVMFGSLSCPFTSIPFVITRCSFTIFVSKYNIGWYYIFIYIHILSYYKLFFYFNLCLSVMSDLMFNYIHIFSYYKLFLYFNVCLRVMLDSLSSLFTSISFLTASCSFT